MANANSADDYSDLNERSAESSDDAESEDSTYDVKKYKKNTSSSRSKSKSKSSKKKSLLKSKATQGKRSKSKKKVSKIKDDSFSEDSLSQMSDVNPPSVATRSRKKKRTPSTTSSNPDSDVRKTKSEPILITIESDSDFDIQSTVSSRPNRSARIQGEMIRKFGLMSHSGNKAGDSSSSSASASNTKKTMKPTFASKAHFPSRLKNQKHHLSLKKRAKIYVRPPLKQARRLKIKNIHERFARKGLGQLSERKQSSRQASLKSLKMDNKSSKRRGSLQDAPESETEDPPKASVPEQPPPPRKLGRPRKKVPPQVAVHAKKDSECSAIEDDIRRIVSASNPGDGVKKVRRSSDAKDALANDGENPAEGDSGETDGRILSEDEIKFEANEEAISNIESDLAKIKNMASAQEEILDGEKRSKILVHSKSKLNKKSHKKKIFNKPLVNVVRRRGRPRLSESVKKPVVSNTTPVDALSLLNIKAQVPFLQNSFCFDVAPKLSKCRECRIAVYRNSKRMYNSYCRFMEYRKLCYNKQGLILSAGFSNPSDATPEHMSQWLPNPQDPPKDLNFETAKSLLEHCGDQFCDLIEQEREAELHHIGLRQAMTWKRIVQGVREMCDVCSTTIFNMHWVCPICGFAVCIDCYKVRKLGVVVEDDDEDRPKDRDEFKWLLCTQRLPHSQDSLVMAQMIPGKALWIMRDLLHKARKRWKIPSYCKCNPEKTVTSDRLASTGINKQLMSFVTKSFSTEKNPSFSLEKNTAKDDTNYDDLDVEVSGSALRWLNGACINSDNINNNLKLSDDNIYNYEDFNILGDSLLQDMQENVSEPDFNSYSLDEIISCVTSNHSKDDNDKNAVKHFNQRYPQPNSGRDPLPIRIYTKIESELAFPEVPHSWFCNGRLLFLHKSNHKDNLALFQEQWKRGQPIVVQGVDEGLDMDLWRPEGFCRDFGEVKNDLVDCKTGAVLKNLPMKKFWEGFENFSKRLTDEDGEYMLLKLKDWPPGEDFSEKLPTRFDDLMKGLPLPEYTHRNGILNLAGRLPSSFVRPDLGPKMYNAYGSALFPQKGTTNLHLDISDAVNVMVYVGIPSDGKCETHIHEALKAIDEAGCDSLMRFRVRNRLAKPGALWHIYNARDADKIRDMLTKVAIERGEKLEAHHDPIHDQSWYIDSELRLRLYRDYGVEGYAIAQCLGDAVFIPAGAPHQVRNLHSCVKVAEDFVSPENIGHCFNLTQEFRNLSDTHTNHEDKLQIKNIIYHVVRDSLSFLLPPDEPIGY